MFSSILTIKKELHKFYDIVRATSPRDIMSPLFKEFKTNEDRQIDEKKKLKEKMDKTQQDKKDLAKQLAKVSEKLRSIESFDASENGSDSMSIYSEENEGDPCGNETAGALPPPTSPGHNGAAKKNVGKRVSMALSKNPGRD
ncbi:hypothetical protein TrST_g9184 [Triparma strigata]|uniref:Uncharacterized protein n=1 Tax=Triparma strigata TaxID=1606541 RepID=A0A9W7AYL8_9STRA|nr:hypothetical protein TrST_g9184 [Triparma strigata]